MQREPGAVDMAADDAIQSAASRVIQPGLDIAGDVALRGAAAPLEELRQRPVAVAEQPAGAVEQGIAGQQPVVHPVAQLLLQPAELRLRVVVVAMRHQQASAVRRRVHGPAPHPHGWQRQAAEASHGAVVVAGDVDDLGARVPQGVQRLHHAVLRRAPPGTPRRHPPQVDDVADQVQPLAAQPTQEGGELVGMAVLRPEVDVGDESGAPDQTWRAGGAHAAASPMQGRSPVRLGLRGAVTGRRSGAPLTWCWRRPTRWRCAGSIDDDGGGVGRSVDAARDRSMTAARRCRDSAAWGDRDSAPRTASSLTAPRIRPVSSLRFVRLTPPPGGLEPTQLIPPEEDLA